MLQPLNKLLKDKSKWNWNLDCQQAFATAKQKLMSAFILAHYDCSLPLKLATDASQFGISAVISQVYPNGQKRIVPYVSRTISTAETQIEKKALSIVLPL